MAMFDFLRKFSDKNRSDGSKNVAKKRLQLVLLQDRAGIRPDVLEALKNDLIAVIGRHLAIDEEAMEVSLNQEGEQVALIANIPVRLPEKADGHS